VNAVCRALPHGHACKRPIPVDRESYCSLKCSKAAARARTRARKVWAETVIRPVEIAVLAGKLGIPAAEASRRAEKNIAQGELLAWRAADGSVASVGAPRPKVAS
jgi:predicted nucleic acid-binding Zn ribbon protein